MADWLQNRTAIVTGAARGIGFAVAHQLGMLGARVLMVDNGCALSGTQEDSAVLSLAADRVPGSLALDLDLAAPGAGARIVAEAVQHFGGVDMVVHAAGILAPATRHPVGERLHQPPPDADVQRTAEARGTVLREAFGAVSRVDVLGALELFEAVVPALQARRAAGRVPGAIVSIGCAEAVYGDAEFMVEAASKAALMSITRSLAHRLSADGIGVNVVIPFAGTRQVAVDAAHSAARDEHHRRIRPLAPSLVANLVSWLCTPFAAGITGQVFMARGREILLFRQTRPEASVFQSQNFDPEELAQAMRAMRRQLTDDWTALDAFGNDPVP